MEPQSCYFLLDYMDSLSKKLNSDSNGVCCNWQCYKRISQDLIYTFHYCLMLLNVFTLSLAAEESPTAVGVRVYCVSSSSIDVPSRLSRGGSGLLKVTHHDHYKLFLVVV